MSVVPSLAEFVEHLDDDGAVLGTVTRAEMRRANLRHRSVSIVVVNRRDELLAHRRARWKDLWPSRWDLAFGGVVTAGEAWEDAAARELAEEAGVHVTLDYLGEESYEDADTRELARVYLARSDGPFQHDDGEVVETAWVPLTELSGWIDGRELCPDSLTIIVPRLDAP
jgi:isopentenyldiphosphate isomerase